MLIKDLESFKSPNIVLIERYKKAPEEKAKISEENLSPIKKLRYTPKNAPAAVIT